MLVVLIVLYVGSQLVSTLIATATADPNQRRLMLLLPIVFVVILYRYPAGLLVYWITTNLWTIGQQLLIRRHMAAAASRPRRWAPPRASRVAPTGGQGADSPASRRGSARPKPARRAQPAARRRQRRPDRRPPRRRPPRKKKKRSGRRR